MTVLICLPIRNEENILANNIEILVDFLNRNDWPFDWELILMINGSSDNSDSIARFLAAKLGKRLRVLEIKEGGKGRAIKYCFDKFINRDILVYMDADLAVSLNMFFPLLNPILRNEADLVMGSRLLADSKTSRCFYRTAISRFYNFLSNLLLKHKLSDLQCGFKAIKAESFKTIRPYLQDNEWFFDTELIVLARHFNYRIKEIPVNWQDNRFSKRYSKVKVLKDGSQFLKSLWNFKLRLRKIKKPQKGDFR